MTRFDGEVVRVVRKRGVWGAREVCMCNHPLLDLGNGC